MDSQTKSKSSQQIVVPSEKLRIGFVGAGNMAFAICEGLITSGKLNLLVCIPINNYLSHFTGYVKPDQIYSTAPSNNNVRKFKVKLQL